LYDKTPKYLKETLKKTLKPQKSEEKKINLKNMKIVFQPWDIASTRVLQ